MDGQVGDTHQLCRPSKSFRHNVGDAAIPVVLAAGDQIPVDSFVNTVVRENRLHVIELCTKMFIIIYHVD